MTLKNRRTGSLIVIISMEMAATSVSEHLERWIHQNGRAKKGTYRRSHILIVPSSLPVTNHLPSLWKHTAVIFPLWPSKIATCKCVYPGNEQTMCF